MIQATIITRILSPVTDLPSSTFSHLKIPLTDILTLEVVRQRGFGTIDFLALRTTKSVG